MPAIVRAAHPDVAIRTGRARKRIQRDALAFRRFTAALARPVATSIGSAPDPRFLRPGLAGVTRCRLSRVYRAPRGPVVVPVGRGPRAARERIAFYPRAGTAPAPLFGSALAKGVPLIRARWTTVTNLATICQASLAFGDIVCYAENGSPAKVARSLGQAQVPSVGMLHCPIGRVVGKLETTCRASARFIRIAAFASGVTG